MNPMLSVNNIVKEYGQLRAVDQVSFEIKPGEIYGLLGPNGAGKTSLISCIVGLEEFKAGAIKLFGDSLSSYNKSKLGFVPQELINHGYFTARQIVEFYAGYYGTKVDHAWIDHLFERVQLQDKQHSKVKQMSGGMKRRLLIIKALSHKPSLILLDEPTAGVDVELRETLWSLVREFKADGKSVLLTTHYLEEAEALCDRIGILNKGKLLKQGITADLIRDLTFKNIKLHLTEDLKVEHEYLVAKEGLNYEFRIPSTLALGDFFNQVGVDPYKMADIEIKEGRLEDAFRTVLGAEV